MTDTIGIARVEGPITGGDHGWPFGATGLDLSNFDYREDEYFLSGDATRYRLTTGGKLTHDGHWDAEPVETAPYKTRILVQIPRNPSKFSGTVVVVWNNVSAGYELFNADWESAFEQGHAVVCVTCQPVAITGLPNFDQGMGHWDPTRYESLSIAGDDHSFDVFSQAAVAVGPNRPRDGVDPLQGLDAQRLVAFGASQSAGRLGSYVNAIQPLTGVFDAIILAIYFGRGTALEVGDQVVNIMKVPANAPALTGANLVRDDQDVKVMVVNSELEAIACHGVRQPDTDSFRYWESAGTCHVSAQSLEARADRFRREFGANAPVRKVERANRVPIGPLYDSALAHVHRWLTEGVAPPVQPLVEFEGERARVVRDGDDIARGGIRLPQVRVPLATNSAVPVGPDIFSLLDGSTQPFTADDIRSRYGDVTTYLTRFEEAINEGEAAGFLLPRHRKPLVEEAGAEFDRLTAS